MNILLDNHVTAFAFVRMRKLICIKKNSSIFSIKTLYINVKSVYFLEKNQDKIDWSILSSKMNVNTNIINIEINIDNNIKIKK